MAYDNGLTTTGIDATLAGVALHLAGGVYDLASPKVRFALTGRGEVAQLMQAVAVSQRQPLTGDLSFAIRALGSLNAPVVSGTFAAPSMVYRGFPLAQAGGTFSLHGRDLDLLGGHLDYGPLAVEAHGSLTLEKQVATDLVIIVRGAGNRLPYAAQLLRGVQLTTVVHVAGVGPRLASDGLVYGDAPDGRLDALFNVDGEGNGVIGPISIERDDGASLYARVTIDRTRASELGVIEAHRFSLLSAPMPTLPGLHMAALPAVAGTLDAQLVGSLDAGRLNALSGHVRLAGLRYGAATADASADIGTTSDGSQRGLVHVGSSFGTLDGAAAYAGGRVGFEGRVRSSFEQLRPLTGNLGGRGGLEASLRVLSSGASTAVQTPELRFIDASVHGVPLGDARATATLNDGRLDVRALQLRVARGTITARGRLGGDGDLDATTSALDLPALAGPGFPLDAGTLSAIVHLRGTSSAPQASPSPCSSRGSVHTVSTLQPTRSRTSKAERYA